MKLKELRKRANLRTVDVAHHLQGAESTVRNWESGKTIPKLRVDQLLKLLEIYQCSWQEFAQAVQETCGHLQGVWPSEQGEEKSNLED